MVDVGGQPLHRDNWPDYFPPKTADESTVIFVVDISAYDQVVPESKDLNRLQEALDAFGTIVNARFVFFSVFVI